MRANSTARWATQARLVYDTAMLLRRALPLLLALLVALPAAAQTPPSPREQAEQLARKGKTEQAIELLRKAPSLDAEGHYLLGALLAVERRKGRVCEADAYRGEIVAQVFASIEGGEAFKERALKDPRFAVIHDTMRWQQLLNRTPERVSHVPQLLTRVTFHGPAHGIYGSSAELRFDAKGRVRGWRSVWDDKADMPRHRAIAGTYQVDARKVTLRLGGGLVWHGELGEDGVLTIDGQGQFRDEPSECEA